MGAHFTANMTVAMFHEISSFLNPEIRLTFHLIKNIQFSFDSTKIENGKALQTIVNWVRTPLSKVFCMIEKLLWNFTIVVIIVHTAYDMELQCIHRWKTLLFFSCDQNALIMIFNWISNNKMFDVKLCVKSSRIVVLSNRF